MHQAAQKQLVTTRSHDAALLLKLHKSIRAPDPGRALKMGQFEGMLSGINAGCVVFPLPIQCS